jgi:predicted metal-dependent phosphoesterase TrpH
LRVSNQNRLIERSGWWGGVRDSLEVRMPDGYLNVELHCHTVASFDGVITLDSLLRTLEAAGLDAVAVTDHDTIDGALGLRELVQKRGLPIGVIVGEERTLDDGSHLIGLFLERPIQSHDLAGALREIEEQGGLCLIPHPFRRKDGLLRNGLDPLKLFEGRVAGFELFSAKCSFEENRRAAGLLQAGTLAPFGGSDAHYESDLGECINEVSRRGDLRTSIQQMFERRAPFRILGKHQRESDGERRYAPLYYKIRKQVRLPRLVLPFAKHCYRHYRNLRYGIGRKALREVYHHA